MIPNKSKEFSVKIGEEDIVLYFKRPNVSELKYIDLEYRKIFAEAIREGVMTEAEAKKKLKDSGAWTKDDEIKINEISFQIALLSKELDDVKDVQKGLEIVDKLTSSRSQLIELIRNRTELFYNTAEGLSNDNRIHKFIELCCIRKDKEERFFDNRESYEKFVSEEHDTLSEIFKQASFFEYGTPEDQTLNWSEVQWIKLHKEELKKMGENKNKLKKRRIK